MDNPSSASFPIIGIGASAGGWDALLPLLNGISLADCAVVIVQHLSTADESLTERISRVTAVRARTVEDRMLCERGTVYVAPPDSNVSMFHGVFQVTQVGEPRLPIDFFFRALAEDQGSRVVAVILSGTGSDGTFGLKAVKASGGITLVQLPSSAAFDGMPRSAWESGSADYCLTPTEIGVELARISRYPHAISGSFERGGELFTKVFNLLRSAFGLDLTHYKHSTVQRRIVRRMTLRKLDDLNEYLQLLKEDNEELRHLYRDMLINVTSFFRDMEPFDVLKDTVLTRMLEEKRSGEPIRIWVAGCSTGEEAYSLAILLVEFLGERTADHPIQIFATDVDEEAIAQARRGVFPENIMADVSAERLRRFFVKHEDRYEVARRIRDMIVFATQDVTKDAPFSRLDLVSCRNLLIYLQSATQKRVLRIFHYALNPQGVLLLGVSETVGELSDLFSLVDKKNKIYMRKNIAANASFELGSSNPVGPSRDVVRRVADLRPILSVQQLADRKVLERYGPSGVIVNEGLDVLQFRGRTGQYLEPAPGTATLNILKLVRPELHVPLRSALHQALTDERSVVLNALHFKEGENRRSVSLEVIPIREPETGGRCLLILFHESELNASATESRVPPPVEGQPDARIEDLERELSSAKEYLQRTIEELETSNEELKSSNEELQSANEELQSANEELETSKEELQSANEELTTVNDELQNRMDELSQSTDDFHNLLNSVDSAILLTGMDLRIRRFTRRAEELLNLVSDDVGRSIALLKRFFPAVDLEHVSTEVINRVTAEELQVPGADDRWYRLRISPYKTADHSIRGTVLSIVEADTEAREQGLTLEVRDYAESVLSSIPHPLLILDARHRVVWANVRFYRLFRVSAGETVGQLLQNLGDGQWAHPGLKALLEKVLTDNTFSNMRMTHTFESIGERTMKLSASVIPNNATRPRLIVLLMEQVEGGTPAE